MDEYLEFPAGFPPDPNVMIAKLLPVAVAHKAAPHGAVLGALRSSRGLMRGTA